MNDSKKKKADLVKEIGLLRRRVVDLERSLSGLTPVPDNDNGGENPYRIVAEYANDAIIIIHGEELLYYNPKYLEMLGYEDPRAVLGKSPFSFVHPEDLEMVMEHGRRRQQKAYAPEKYEFRAVRADGSVIWVEISSALIDFRGKPATLGYLRDITEHKGIEEALKESEERFRRLSDAAFEGILIHDGGKILDINEPLLVMTGYDRDYMTGKSVLDFVADESKPVILKHMGGDYDNPFDIRLITRSGHKLRVEVFGKPIAYKGIDARVVAVLDVTKRKQMEEEIKLLAITDQLTGLYNRRGFFMLADRYLKASKRTGKSILLGFVDLDNLKWINDTFGHEAGDKALVNTAGILLKSFREYDVIARIGGDEFVVLAVDSAEMNPESFSLRLGGGIEAFNEIGGGLYTLAMSWGTALYDPGSPVSLDQLVALADRAMYACKRNKAGSRDMGRG